MNRMDNNMKIYRNDRNKLVKKSINDVILYLLEIINQKISKKQFEQEISFCRAKNIKLLIFIFVKGKVVK